jgi:crotonobetainyl-CoA:carnitine CoA-transferase CaiB-like acyl-CoA transferase
VTTSTGALAGVNVLDLSQGVAGPFCGKLLAGLGAEVIKVEPPEGDLARRIPPYLPAPANSPERSALFQHLNTGKRSIALNLAIPSERTAFDQLVLGWANVVIVSDSVSRSAELGLDWATLKALRPALVLVTITDFGHTGPDQGYAGSELAALARGGYLYLTGEPDREPLKPWGYQAQYHAGLHAAAGTVAALLRTEATGAGEHVDVSTVVAATFLSSAAPGWSFFYDEEPARVGNRLANLDPKLFYPSTLRPCKDGWVHAHNNVRNPELLEVLTGDSRLSDPELTATPKGHADQIDAILDRWLADKSKRDVVEEAQTLRVPFTEVLEPREVVVDPHLTFRSAFVELEHPATGKAMVPRAPIRFSSTPWSTTRAPLLGEHTAEVLTKTFDRATANPAAPTGESNLRRPLDGVRVLELGLAVAGPVSGQILGDMGADVIKVEAPFARSRRPSEFVEAAEGPAPDPWNRIPKFNELNRSKRGIALDLASSAGRDVFLRLVELSDIVLENFSSRVLGNLDLDYAVLREHNPAIILVSMPGFGKDGPYANRVSYGPGIDAMSGLADLSGYLGGGPIKPGNHYCDQNAGVLGALAAMSALRHRRRTGQGQQVELAMLEGGIQTVGEALLAASAGVPVDGRLGNRSDHMAPHGVFRCEGDDAWVAIAVVDDEQWQSLCRLLGRSDLAVDATLRTTVGRMAHQESIEPVLAEWCAGRSPRQAEHLLQQAGVSAAAVLKPSELLTDPHLRELQSHVYLQHPSLGRSPVPSVAWRLVDQPSPPQMPAPCFAADNDEVLGELLGMDRGAIAGLRSINAVVDAPTKGG